jgi:hypothetical protein
MYPDLNDRVDLLEGLRDSEIDRGTDDGITHGIFGRVHQAGSICGAITVGVTVLLRPGVGL